MIKFLILSLIFISSLYANKVIYISYNDAPKRVIEGEIFTVTFKVLSTIRQNQNISYKFFNHRGVRILDRTPKHIKKGKFYYDTFHMLCTSRHAKLPDLEASLVAHKRYPSSFLKGKELNVIHLNPKKNFSNIIANELKLNEYKTTEYDNNYNIVVFVLSAKNANINAMHLNNVYKQGKESSVNSYNNSKITYFAILSKRYEHLKFSYFNLIKNKFEIIDIPIIVDDDSVTTQSDLKPRDQSHDLQKIYVASAIAILLFIFFLFKRKIIYIIITLIPLAYIAYLSIPEQNICIKEGAQIHLLPVDNGTIFETTDKQLSLAKEGKTDRYIKIKLQNNKIGWVKNEDTCSY